MVASMHCIIACTTRHDVEVVEIEKGRTDKGYWWRLTEVGILFGRWYADSSSRTSLSDSVSSSAVGLYPSSSSSVV